MRKCSRCGVEKPDTEYYACGKYVCRQCIKERAKKWYSENAERAKANVSAYQKANPAKVKVWNDKWFKDNKEKRMDSIRKYCKQYPERRAKSRAGWNNKNKERIARVCAAWAKANREKCSAYWAAYKASKLRAIPGWADVKAIKEIYAEATRLTKQTGILHHVDHCVPLKSAIVQGLHCEANLQILTASKNTVKSNKIWPNMP